MEKGTRKDWTIEREEKFNNILDTCRTFAERQLIISLRDVLKYDQRSKAGKIVTAKAELRLGTSTDDELADMVSLEAALTGKKDMEEMLKRLEELEKLRADIIRKGIKKSELEQR